MREVGTPKVRHDALDHARLPEEVRARLREPGVYTAFEIADLLLGPLADVAVSWQVGRLRLDVVPEMFGWYVGWRGTILTCKRTFSTNIVKRARRSTLRSAGCAWPCNRGWPDFPRDGRTNSLSMVVC